MAHFQIIFEDEIHGMQINHFENYDDAQDYWDTYADIPTCYAGGMIDLDDAEVIWEFGKEYLD